MDGFEQRFASILSRAWWGLLLRGLIAIAFGVLTWMRPGISLAALVLVFGVYALFDGAVATFAALAGRKEQEDWWILLLGGLLGVGVGVLTLMNPGLTALGLLFYIAIWAIAQGVLEIVAAIRLRREIRNEWALILAGALTLTFGVVLMARPGAGALAVLWLIGLYAIGFGTLLVILAFKARSFGKHIARTA